MRINAIRISNKTIWAVTTDTDPNGFDITAAEYEGLRAGTHAIADDLQSVREKTAEELTAEASKKRIEELKALLTATDYQSHKHADGAMSDEDFEPIRAQRQAWRDEINLLEESI